PGGIFRPLPRLWPDRDHLASRPLDKRGDRPRAQRCESGRGSDGRHRAGRRAAQQSARHPRTQARERAGQSAAVPRLSAKTFPLFLSTGGGYGSTGGRAGFPSSSSVNPPGAIVRAGTSKGSDMKLVPVIRAAALLSAVALIPATTAGLAQVDGRVSPEFAKFFATYQKIKSSYVEPVEDEVLIKGAINGMLAALDPHSTYLDGAALERLETMIDGNYQGLGISVVMEDGAVKVVSPFKGSPADKAGIKAGDYITHLDGKLIYGLELDEAVAQMRGPAGSAIMLTVFRTGAEEPLELSVTRGVIDLEPVTHELTEGGIGVISVNEFSRDVGADVRASLEALREETTGRLNGLVLDLRRNPGGSLDEAVALSDLFLTEGQIVSQRGRNSRDTIYYD